MNSRILFLSGTSIALTWACQTTTQRDAVAQDMLERFVLKKTEKQVLDFVGGALRLAFHDAGSFRLSDDPNDLNKGLPNGCIDMTDGDNAGLQRVLDMLEPVDKQFPECSTADLYALAGAVATDVGFARAGNRNKPMVNSFRWGRHSVTSCPIEHERLPRHQPGLSHMRDVFTTGYGFNDQEMVALMGAHSVGRAHQDASGFDFAWDQTPTSMDNEYYKDILDLPAEWARASVKERLSKKLGRPRNSDAATTQRMWMDAKRTNPITEGKNMMLNSDMALVWNFGTNDIDTPMDVASSCQINWPAEHREELEFTNPPYHVIAPNERSRFAGQCKMISSREGTLVAVENYARDQRLFHRDFEKVYNKLMALGYSNANTEPKLKGLCAPCAPTDEICCCNTIGSGCRTPAPQITDQEPILVILNSASALNIPVGALSALLLFGQTLFL